MNSIDDIFVTKRGRRCVLIQGYKLSENKQLKDRTFHFRCTNRKCNVTAIIGEKLDLIISQKNDHKHPATSENILNRQKIMSTLKRKAIDDVFTKPNKIIRKVLKDQTTVNISHSDVRLFRKSMYEARRKLILTIPKSIDEAKHQLFSNQNDIIANNNEQFCFMKNNESIPIFTCYTNLVMLCEVREIFADGTFTYCPSYFYQLYTIHILQNNYYLPLIYCFLNSKSTDKYKEMWTLIKELCKKMINKEIQINKIHLDFEKSAHIAIEESFPTVQIIACQFHLSQNWYRKIQSNNYLLNQYKNNTEIGLWLKYFFGLAFLPPEQVDDSFVELMSIAPTDNHTFTDYILENYINKESQFPPNIWAETPINNTRTTNGPEAFHKHFNAQFYHPHPNIHHVVDVLTNIQAETALKINSIKKNQFNYTRKEAELKRKFLIDNWNAYDKGDITLIEYLKIMGIRYQGNKI